MDTIEELLPGIEEFLSETLAAETLSSFTEQRRLYFLERLDIIKLPPTLLPRKGRVLPEELLNETETKSGVPAYKNNNNSDFAATQREIARSWSGSTGQVHEVSNAPNRKSVGDDQNEEGDHDEDKIKDYVDIDTTEIQKIRSSASPTRSIASTNPYDDEEINKDTNQAEMDALIRHGVPASNRSSIDLDASVRTASLDGSIDCLDANEGDDAFRQDDDDNDDDDNKENDYEIPVARQQLESDDGSAVTPPLPRRELKFSDSESRNSVDAVDEIPPELPYRPPLPRRNEVYARSGCSDRSDPDISGDGNGDSTSYETFDEDEDPGQEDLKGMLGIKLPRRVPKKKSGLKMTKKSMKSRSLSTGAEINVPFRKLATVDISGELSHKGKLSWNRRLVAISNGCLAMYKPDKDARPLLVIPLMGYEAAVDEREGKRGFEIKITHPQDDTHLFSVDFKEWAVLWKEHINEVSKGGTPSKYHTHLARTISGDFSTLANMKGSKADLTGSNSNLSTGSDGGAEDFVRPRLRSGSNKVMRMGSFAFRASQFFENISRRSSTSKRKLSAQSSSDSVIPKGHGSNEMQSCNGIVEESSLSSNSSGKLHPSALTPTSDLNMPMFSDTNSSSIPNSPSTPLERPVGWLGSIATEGQGHANIDLDSNQGSEESSDIAHKGHLYIFSTFNRRRWGKRWCLVRNNMFECYRSSTSSQCEITFVLGACVMRRAYVETSSPLALMLIEAEKEVITVEPVSEEEMTDWVQVLMAETATLFIPEGLEEYMKKPELDANSLLSFSVLKQWDMDLSSPRDYEEPGEVSSLTKSESSISNDKSLDSTKEKTEENASLKTSADLPILEALEKQQICKVKCSPSSNSHNKNKNTTDSGFYSVKGTNSDSDMEDTDMARNTHMPLMDCGYSIAHSDGNNFELQNSSTYPSDNKTSGAKIENPSSSFAADKVSGDEGETHQTSAHPCTCCANSTTYCLAQSITDAPLSSMPVLHSKSHSPSVSPFSNSSQPSQKDGNSMVNPSPSQSPHSTSIDDNQGHLSPKSSETDNQSDMVCL